MSKRRRTPKKSDTRHQRGQKTISNVVKNELKSELFEYYKRVKIIKNESHYIHFLVESSTGIPHYTSKGAKDQLSIHHVRIIDRKVFITSKSAVHILSGLRMFYGKKFDRQPREGSGSKRPWKTLKTSTGSEMLWKDISEKWNFSDSKSNKPEEANKRHCVLVGIITFAADDEEDILYGLQFFNKRLQKNYVHGFPNSHPEICFTLYCSQKKRIDPKYDHFQFEEQDDFDDNTKVFRITSVTSKNAKEKEAVEAGGEEEEEIRKVDPILYLHDPPEVEKQNRYKITTYKSILNKGCHWGDRLGNLFREYVIKRKYMTEQPPKYGEYHTEFLFSMGRKCFYGSMFDIKGTKISKNVHSFMMTKKRQKRNGFRYSGFGKFSTSDEMSPTHLMNVIEKKLDGKFVNETYRRISVTAIPRKKKKKKISLSMNTNVDMRNGSNILRFHEIYESEVMAFLDWYHTDKLIDMHMSVKRYLTHHSENSRRYYGDLIRMFEGKELNLENYRKWMTDEDYICTFSLSTICSQKSVLVHHHDLLGEIEVKLYVFMIKNNAKKNPIRRDEYYEEREGEEDDDDEEDMNISNEEEEFIEMKFVFKKLGGLKDVDELSRLLPQAISWIMKFLEVVNKAMFIDIETKKRKKEVKLE